MLRLEHVCVRWSLSVCVCVCCERERRERDGVLVCVCEREGQTVIRAADHYLRWLLGGTRFGHLL